MLRFTSLQLKVMFGQKLSLHFQHTWIFVTWHGGPGLTKTIYPQLKVRSIGFTSIERYFKSMGWWKTFRCHANIPWSTMLRALPCLEHQTDCVHQLLRHVTFLQSKSHGEDPAVSMHSPRSSSQTNASRNFLLADKISPVGGCYL